MPGGRTSIVACQTDVYEWKWTARSRLSTRSLGQYFALGYVPDPDCIFEGVKKLPPGHVLTWSRERGA